MRILVAHDVEQAHAGGMNRIMRFTHELLAAQGHQVDYFCAEDVSEKRSLLRRFKFPWAVLQHAVGAFKRGHGYDIVNVHEAQGAAIARFKYAAGNPYVVVTSHGAEHRAWDLALDERRRHRKGPALKTFILNPTTRLSQVRHAIAHSDHLMCLSEQDREYFAQRMGVDPTKTSRIYPGASSVYYAADPERLARPVRNILFGGTWRKGKGIEDVVGAFSLIAKRHPEIRLTILGAGLRADAVKQDFPSTLRDRVSIIETGGDEENVAQLERADTFLLPSLFEETPLALIEAMAAALPIITTNTSGMKDVVRDGDNGLLVPVRSPNAIAMAMDRIISDSQMRITLAARAQREAKSTYTWGRSAGNILAIYEDLIARDRAWQTRSYSLPANPKPLKFCFVSNFAPNWNSGAAGSILAIGSNLEKLDNSVQYIWQQPNQASLGSSSLNNLFALPRTQLRQVRNHLQSQPTDVLVVSQPFAYQIFEQLPKQFPNTLFLNLTHGWEHRDDLSEVIFECSGPFRGKRAWKRTMTMLLRARSCRRTAESMHGFLAPCSKDGHFVLRTYGVSPEKLLLMTYGLDDSFFTGQVHPQTPPNGCRMLFFGQYFPRKGSRLLEAILPRIARDFPDAELTFIVPDRQVTEVRAPYADAFGDRLHVLTWMDRVKVAQIAAENDILLFPSYLEGFGKTFLEGMAWGLCVIGFAEGGLPDIAVNGEHALYCEVGDEPGYEVLLRRCLDNPAMTRQIGQRACAKAHQYAWEQTAQKLLGFCVERLKSQLG